MKNDPCAFGSQKTETVALCYWALIFKINSSLMAEVLYITQYVLIRHPVRKLKNNCKLQLDFGLIQVTKFSKNIWKHFYRKYNW